MPIYCKEAVQFTEEFPLFSLSNAPKKSIALNLIKKIPYICLTIQNAFSIILSLKNGNL